MPTAMEIGAELLGQSAAMIALRDQVKRLMQRSASGRLPPVLIEGETGTGKGLLAGALHRAGPRAARPFVDVNCGAIPENLLESELFGHEKGAFTDARHAKAGLFHAAHGGTLFLDELGLLPLALQGKLLKVVEERIVRRLGSTRSEPVDVWIVGATSEDLGAALLRGRLREDLYHRLAVLTLRLPPLRERGPDILLLADHFLARASADYRRPAKLVTPDAREALLAYAWPGNVRELANVMERVTLLSDRAEVTAESLGLPTTNRAASGTTASGPLKEAVWTVERERLVAALEQAGGNLSRAAARLGIPRNTLRYRLERHGLLPEGAGTSRLPRDVVAPAPAATAPRNSAPAPPPPATLRWERRHVAFLAAALDLPPGPDAPPEAGRRLELMIEKVASFGGRIEELGPTGVVAVFGLEPAGDAAALAAMAAMAIATAAHRARRLEPGPPVGSRLAVHAQPAQVGRVGATVAIDPAARRAAGSVLEEMLVQMRAGDILVSPAAALFLERRFELTEAPSGSLGFRLTGREHVGLPIAGSPATLVGRRSELELLRRCLDSARQGSGQVVGIVGEAGMGKSRLVSEFRRGLYGAAVLCLESHCLAQGSSIPYFPLRELLRLIFGLAEAEDPGLLAEKLAAGVRGIGLEPDAAVPWLLELLESGARRRLPPELSPEAVQARTFEVLRHLALQASRQTPLLVVVEDAHWVDSTSEAFLASLAESIAGERVLLLVTYRPGYRPSWAESAYATQIALPALSAEESLAVVRAVLRSEVPPDVEAAILSRAEGNPFFLEELARAAARPDSLGQGGIPATLEAALIARIEGLPAITRRVLQTASVLGRQFGRRLLESVWTEPASLELHLRDLKRLDLLQERVRLDEPSCSFKHALIQEAAYESLAPADRRAVHGASARVLEALHADRPDDACELVAHHWLRSEEPEKALDALERSNRKAARASAVTEAKGYFYEALRLLERQPDTPDGRRRRLTLLVDQVLVMSLLFRFEEYHELLKRHEDVALALDDAGLSGAFLARRGACEWATGRYEQAIATFAEAAELCESGGHAEGAAQAWAVRQWAHLYKGEYEAVLAVLPRVARALESRPGPRWQAYALGAASRACTYLGRWEAAVDYARQELALAERFSDDGLASHAGLTLALAEGARGDLQRAVEHGELALAKAPTPADKTWARAILAWAWCQAGEPARGLKVLSQVVAGSRAVRWRAGEFYAVWLGEAYLMVGDHARARQELRDCLQIAEEHGMRYLIGAAHRLLGEAAGDADPAEAAVHFERSLAVLGEIQAENELALAHAGYGRLLCRQGAAPAARGHFERALEILERLGTLREPERVRGDLARLGGP